MPHSEFSCFPRCKHLAHCCRSLEIPARRTRHRGSIYWNGIIIELGKKKIHERCACGDRSCVHQLSPSTNVLACLAEVRGLVSVPTTTLGDIETTLSCKPLYVDATHPIVGMF